MVDKAGRAVSAGRRAAGRADAGEARLRWGWNRSSGRIRARREPVARPARSSGRRDAPRYASANARLSGYAALSHTIQRSRVLAVSAMDVVGQPRPNIPHRIRSSAPSITSGGLLQHVAGPNVSWPDSREPHRSTALRDVLEHCFDPAVPEVFVADGDAEVEAFEGVERVPEPSGDLGSGDAGAVPERRAASPHVVG